MNKLPVLDVKSHLRNHNYNRAIFIRRIIWGLLEFFFHYSPRPLYGFRNFILRLQGAKIGKHVLFYPSVEISFPWNISVGEWTVISWNVRLHSLGKIEIGSNVIISQYSTLCAGNHDYKQPNLPLLKPKIVIGDETWICSEAFIGPGVSIGERSVIGARAVITKDVPPESIAFGNPAKIRSRF
jgi:putative colanic acid biosynthesis acetyltransferase WcaF